MALDITLLRILKYRKDYEQLRRMVPEKAMDPMTRTVLDDYGKWFDQHDMAVIHMDSFITYMRIAHPTLTDDQMTLLASQLRKAETDAEPGARAAIVEQLIQTDTAYRVSLLVDSWNQGEEVDLLRDVGAIIEKSQLTLDRRTKLPEVEDDIEDLMEEDENDEGLRWPLMCLNMAMRPARPGDLIGLAANVGAGKTSAGTHIATHWAPQLEEGRCGLWLCNEGPGRRIKGRLWQSALGMTFEEMRVLRDQKKLRSAYAAKVGGIDKIRVMDIHDMWSHEIEDIIKLTKPGFVVFDMIDHIRFGGDLANGGQRTDQVLEEMYKWARVQAVKHNFVGLAMSQTNGDAAGMQFPLLHMLKDSRVGKQGQLDALIMLGKSNDLDKAKSRFISIPKTKLNRPGKPGDPRCEVLFDEDRGILKDAE